MMAPDVSSLSLSPSRSPSSAVARETLHDDAAASPHARSPSVSLAAAASINAAERNRQSSSNGQASPQSARVTERRQSTLAMNLNLNDPSLPGPGELAASDPRASATNSPGHASHRNSFHIHSSGGDPHHQRAPSLGEIHQEMEQEQEAQVVSELVRFL